MELDAVARPQSEGLYPVFVSREFDTARREFCDPVGVGLERRERRGDIGKQRVLTPSTNRAIAQFVVAHVGHAPTERLREELMAPANPQRGHVRPVDLSDPRREVVNPLAVVVHGRL